MKKLSLLILVLSIYANFTLGQQLAPKKIQSLSQNAIDKAYKASIRMWAYDTVNNQQAGPQFSGVVVSGDGHILTAAHVNTPGQTYLVTFPDGKTAIATGLGEIEFKDSPMLPDVAMMKIVSKGSWPFAELGWSSAIKVYEPVISIAYPETLNQHLPLVRFGSTTKTTNEYGFIESTCRMEPGDSGGPLFDYLGRVIGLHSAINGNIDYEVPVDMYRRYWTALHTPQTYTALPSITDSIGSDPVDVISIPALSNLNNSLLNTANRLTKNVVSISSAFANGNRQITGTIIKTAKGVYVLSKSSMVGEKPIATLADGKEMPIVACYREKHTDLVLLRADTKLKGGIPLKAFYKDTLAQQDLGELLFSPIPAVSEMEVSILGSTSFSLPKIAGMAYLGAAVAFQQPVAITVVQPGSPAGNAELQVGDEVVDINDQSITKPEDYGQQLMKYWAGDTINFDIRRNGTILRKRIILTSRAERPATHPADLFEGGKSSRRDGFDTVFAHGANINPAQCGGPIFNQKGKFYGINIARFSRTTTVAIPSKSIISFLAKALATIQSP